ncbi:DUF4184 family protein [Flavobacterium sp. KACC 22761]|uniref:DUF4184 family protein n=1 Tax=Flavobacterium sp. KACC 22761 TaxID=3092665 RepID=UPI002A75FFC0|nr:DUF4184 family protein [Flavobacterium sp. KACC 22761]WPO79408.1 DUF4184 family protein [Flavobacterium sp. KACC 22761]
MPFTFSHPAIILPFKYFPKRWFSMTGLVIGSLTPDFEYFIRMKVKSIYSHTFLGILWFDLPLAIVLAFIFHNIVRNSLFINLPKPFQKRLHSFTEFNWNIHFKKSWFVILISILIGIISHLFWDAFTHEHGYFVSHIPDLSHFILLFEKKIPIWKIFQHLSTFIGGLFILLALFKLPKNSIYISSINKKYWIILSISTVAILIVRFSVSFDIKAFGNRIVSLISAILASLILTPLIIKSKVN